MTKKLQVYFKTYSKLQKASSENWIFHEQYITAINFLKFKHFNLGDLNERYTNNSVFQTIKSGFVRRWEIHVYFTRSRFKRASCYHSHCPFVPEYCYKSWTFIFYFQTKSKSFRSVSCDRISQYLSSVKQVLWIVLVNCITWLPKISLSYYKGSFQPIDLTFVIIIRKLFVDWVTAEIRSVCLVLINDEWYCIRTR